MSERPVIDELGFPHGDKGYRRGCGCDECRAGHNARIAGARARKRAAEPVATAATHKAGKVEQTVRRELKEASDCAPPWVQTLHELALRNARAIDQVLDDGGKLNLLSPLQGKLLDVLDRIRTAAPAPRGAGAPPPSPADDVEDYVNGLRKFG